MKTAQVNLRLEATLIAAIDDAARMESLERGTMMRKLLHEGLDRWRLEHALTRYQRGEISIGRAVQESSLTHWDFQELVRARGIAYPLAPEDAEERIAQLTGRASRVAEPAKHYGSGRRPGAGDVLPDFPNARAGLLLVGINPGDAAVRTGHYFQGALGRRIWKTLTRVGVLKGATPGTEDVAWAAARNGITDLVKRSTTSGSEVSRTEKKLGVETLRVKVKHWSPRGIIFAFKAAAVAAFGDREIEPGPGASFEGIPTFLLGGPFIGKAESARLDAELVRWLGSIR